MFMCCYLLILKKKKAITYVNDINVSTLIDYFIGSNTASLSGLQLKARNYFTNRTVEKLKRRQENWEVNIEKKALKKREEKER